MEPLVVVREVGCRADRERLWLALADTHRFARALGGGPVTQAPLGGAGAARFLATTRVAGLTITYEERPFEWRAPELLVIRRAVLNGPAKDYCLAFRLEERAGGGCTITIRLEVAARNIVGWPFVRVQVARLANRMVRLLGRIDANLRAGTPPYPDTGGSHAHPGALARAISALAAQLDVDQRALARRLGEHVAAVPDIDAGRIRPYVLAERWGEDRREVLRLCLHAVSAGLLDLAWELVCPSCRVGASQVSDLGELGAEVHCQLCDLTTRIDFDRAVEVTFHPAVAVRSFAAGPYCISGPFRAPHVLEQAIVPAHGAVVLNAPRRLGRYRVLVRGGALASVDVGTGGTTRGELRAGDQLEPSEIRVAPGAELVVTDCVGAERHVRLEHLEWASYAATAYEVSTLPAFRRLFSTQVLKPGRLLSVTRATFVFTDLTRSTELYAELGDAAAYSFVQDHLDRLTACVERHGGAVVKTLGDSIMAVFPDEVAGVHAAVAMQRDCLAFAVTDGPGFGVGLKVGVYAGPCYAVTANGLLDYFGQSVNSAQRLETAADAGDIIMLAALARRSRDANELDGATISEEFRATLKGIREPLDLARVRVAPARGGDGTARLTPR